LPSERPNQARRGHPDGLVVVDDTNNLSGVHAAPRVSKNDLQTRGFLIRRVQSYKDSSQDSDRKPYECITVWLALRAA
jgi:hypothetical protein